MADALSSIWGNLSEHLIASFYEVKRDGSRVDEDVTVWAPLTEASLDATLQWQSPFEQVGQSSLPTLQQLLQSGALLPGVKAIAGDGAASNLLASVEGKTTITKLNSVQVFSGMPPVKIQVTALFRAYKDTNREVENPVNQLMKWALPVHLEGDKTVLARLADGISAGTIFPSTVPVLLAMKYKNRTYSPIVIENIGIPLSSPIDKLGNFTELSVPITLATLTAIDRDDWANYNENSWTNDIKIKRIR